MNLAGKRIVTYSRYSSDNQRDASIEDQQRKACEYIAKNSGDPTLAVHFQDRAISASSLQRDGFEAMMTLVRARKVDVIITENTDRISRDLADSAIVFREVRYLEVPLIGVSNGFNSSAENAQIQFMLEAWKNEQYLKDLSYKTRRGLEGRALKGLSTGGIPIGYTSVPEHGPDGDVIGKKVILDEPRAELVRRIFRMYLEGLSLDRIAYKLNDEKVEPARRGKYKNKGWNAGTIREILRNEAYVGVWTYGKRRWVKVPGTNNRRYRPAPPEQVIRREYPERRIIDPQTWREVQARIATVRAYYAGTKDKPKGMAQSGKKASHILNGLLRCATCGSRMIVYGGSTTRYLRCSNNKKKC